MPTFTLKRYGPKDNFYVFWTENGRSERWSTRTPDGALAETRRNKFVQDMLTPQLASPDEMPISTALLRYEEEHAIGVASQETSALAIKHLCAYYDGKPVSCITKASNKKYEVDMRKLKLANATINRRRNVLRAALNHAKENGDLTVVPSIPTLPEPPTIEEHLSRGQAARLLLAVRPARWRYMALFVRLGIYTGARHRAILQLTWDRVDLENGRIDFRLPGEAETKKRRPNAPVSGVLLRALRVARKNATSKYVVSHRGGPLLSVKKAFAEACKRAKLKNVTPHVMKHTYISWALQNGVSVWDVSGLTATSVETITRVYGHHIASGLKEAAQRATRNGRATGKN